ncbi:MAG: cytidine deaminase [Flavobacteriales bacterium]
MSKTKTLELQYQEFEQISDLSMEYQNLIESAKIAQAKAYAPYSNFKVGAALLLEDQSVVLGNNQENAAYPSGLCAERVAFFAYGAQQHDSKIKALAVVAGSEQFDFKGVLSPCGACRQVMLEYEHLQNQAIPILLFSGKGSVILLNSLADLLPFGFLCQDLKKN